MPGLKTYAYRQQMKACHRRGAHVRGGLALVRSRAASGAGDLFPGIYAGWEGE
ncbi:MAG: hypothetical protein H7Z21_17255 [Hymenobacter sp.]|nr:hypothetical protein [Hymenobacter sp.]